MEQQDIWRTADWQKIAVELRDSEQPEMEKLAYAFGWITDRMIEQGIKDIEVAKALRDEDSVVKNQIKTEVARHARSIFQQCHLLATGRKAWGDE